MARTLDCNRHQLPLHLPCCRHVRGPQSTSWQLASQPALQRPYSRPLLPLCAAVDQDLAPQHAAGQHSLHLYNGLVAAQDPQDVAKVAGPASATSAVLLPVNGASHNGHDSCSEQQMYGTLSMGFEPQLHAEQGEEQEEVPARKRISNAIKGCAALLFLFCSCVMPFHASITTTITIAVFACTLVDRCTSLDDLRAVLEAEGPQFEPRNVSHAANAMARLHHALLGRLASARLLTPAALHHHHQAHLGPCRQLLDSLVRTHAPAMDAWGVSGCLWAYSCVEHYDRALFDALCSRALVVAGTMRPADVANIMVAFGRWGHYHPELLHRLPQVWVC
jgi:hypothetical protein